MLQQPKILAVWSKYMQRKWRAYFSNHCFQALDLHSLVYPQSARKGTRESRESARGFEIESKGQIIVIERDSSLSLINSIYLLRILGKRMQPHPLISRVEEEQTFVVTPGVFFLHPQIPSLDSASQRIE
jgi:hypothetical protein